MIIDHMKISSPAWDQFQQNQRDFDALTIFYEQIDNIKDSFQGWGKTPVKTEISITEFNEQGEQEETDITSYLDKALKAINEKLEHFQRENKTIILGKYKPKETKKVKDPF